MEKMTLEAYLKGLQDKGENGTSKHKLRNENLQEKHRVARIQRLKKEKKKKSKLVLFAELAFPFNPTTGEADDVYGPDSKFRPEVTPTEAALMMKGYAHENAALKESLMRRAGVDNWDTSAVDQFTDDDKVIFKRYRVPSLYTFPVVNINIPVMTKDFARDYLIKIDRDPMTGEVLGDVPVALQANRFFRSMAFEESQELDKMIEEKKIELTETQVKEKKRAIWGRVPVSDDHPVNYAIVVELPLSNTYDLDDIKLSAVTPEEVKNLLRITKYSSGLKDAMQKYLHGDWIKYDKYFDFWEIDMACPSEGDTPMAIGKDTTFEKPSEKLIDTDGFSVFEKSMTTYIDDRDDIEQIVINSTRITVYDERVESQLCSALSTVVDPDSPYLTKAVIESNQDFIALALGDIADQLLMSVAMDSDDREQGTATIEAVNKAAKSVDLEEIMTDDMEDFDSVE